MMSFNLFRWFNFIASNVSSREGDETRATEEEKREGGEVKKK
jgi:hypothetical protein